MTKTDAIIAELKDNFVRRKGEVDTYFGFLLDVYNGRPSLKFPSSARGAGDEKPFDRSLQKILLANGYLLLYNLVESTMTSIVDAVHRIIEDDNIGFNELRGEVRLVILKQFRAIGADKVPDIGTPIEKKVINAGYRKDKLFSGNIDARKIREVAEDYGILLKIDKSATRDGVCLVQIKSTRNELSHGKKSFVECGSDASIDEMVQWKDEIAIYLELVVSSIEEYLTSKLYLTQ
jgi:hypothetical protein